MNDIDYSSGAMQYRHRSHLHSDDDLAGYLDEAREILGEIQSAAAPEPLGAPLVTEDFEHLRWFPLPFELRGAVEVPDD
jgi:hypothetical protein